MDLENILSRDDVPPDVKNVITNLKDCLESYRKQFDELIGKRTNDLRESEEKYRSLIANIPAVTWMTDHEGKTTFISPNVEKVYGYTPEEIYQAGDRLWFGRVHPDDVEHIKEIYQSLFVGSKEFDVEYRIQNKDGNWIWLHDKAITTYENEGIAYAYGVFSDITERKQTEKALQESEEKWRTLVENAPDIIFTVDHDGKILFINHPPAGLTSEDAVGTSVYDYVEPKYRKIVKQSIKNVYQTEESDRYEIAARGPNDETSWYTTHLGPIKHNDKVQAVLLITRDITERKRMEKALYESEKKFRELAELLPEVIFEMDKKRNITFANQVAFEKFGYTQEDLEKGLNAIQLIVPEETDEATEDLMRISSGGESVGRESTVLRKDGSTFPSMVFINRIVRDDEPVGFRGILVDMTEKKQAEEAIRKERDRVQQYIDMSGGIMFALNLQGEITLINRMGCKILEYNKEELLGKNWFDTCIPERIREPLKIIFEAFTAGKSRREIETIFEKFSGSELEFRVNPVLTKSGTERLVIWANSTIKDESGNMIGVISSGQDITERKQMEKALKESESKLQTMMDAIQTGIVIIDAQSHKIVDANPMALDMIGTTKDNLINSVCHEFMCPTEKGLCPINDLGQRVDQSERILQKTNGELIPILKTVNVMVLDGREFIIESFIDITDRKQTEELMKAQRDLGIALSATTDLMEALDLILNTALKIKEIDSGGIYLIDKDSGDLYLAHYIGFSDNFVQNVSLIKAIDPRAKLVLKGKSVFGPHKQVVPSVNTTRLKERILSLGVIPVLFEEKVVAALNVASHTVKELPSHAKNTLEAIATQIGSTLELKEAEEALRESQEKYQMLVEKLEEGVLLEDVDGKISFINPKAAEMLGAPVEEILGQHWTNIVPPSSLDTTLAESKKRLKGISSSYETNLQSKDGSSIPVIVAATPIFSPEEEFYGVISVFTNIAERKRAEEEIKKERDLAQKYLDTAGVIILAIEANQQISLINKKGCEILGYVEEDILGKNWFDTFIPQRIRAEVKNLFNKLMAGEIELVEYFENPIVPIDGEEKIIGWYNTVLKDNEGKISGTLSSGEDISERKKAEQIRKELEERRENFIYMTTHELRTPLTVIGGYCDFLSEHDEYIDHPRREKIYSILKSNVNRLERLTRDVSHIVQLERGEFLIEKEEINICSFLKSILEPYDHLLGTQFSFQGCPEEPSVIIQVDPDRLQQVMDNVLSNAIKHTPKDRREIVVSMESSIDSVQVFIHDNGAGISPEHLETIFEQFITIPTDYTAIGTGIGLYLSREIIKAHGGTITAQSGGKGRGATFIVEIPREVA